ncbi:PTI1-like tyrosine-protein kinase At3g15890 [Selaginella moellendorffii]|nr:PTI1-like tyrosine-protein kinase At3g15890 [Selaginella moellendorffii]|eukprot:XP_002961127.2 PTI1-like tyrosine-protein kinase At3g15890 [Selaginella moellendorffii]
MATKAIKAFLMGSIFRRLSKSSKCGGNKTQIEDHRGSAATSDDNSEPLPSESGTACVYWGQLPDGTQIAVKRLRSGSSLNSDKEFAEEAGKMGKMLHKNVMRLRGYCVERDERILVYSYMPNSSLLAHLHGAFSYDNLLDWGKRVRVALGCAEGLAYLHHSANPPMIHGNIKASNILLTDDFQPLYTDYGIAALMKKPALKAKVALGYTAPECSSGEAATLQSDVFSFGILLLELISGRRPMEKVEFSMKQHIVDWAEPLILEGKLDCLVDPKLQGRFVPEELKKLVFAATICAQTSSHSRPSMARVVELLQGVEKNEVARV